MPRTVEEINALYSAGWIEARANGERPRRRERRMALGLYDVTRLTVAYHAVLDQLGLSEREDAATLRVAKQIVDIVAQGERDPERLTAAPVEALTK
jgi:hypothetical protein